MRFKLIAPVLAVFSLINTIEHSHAAPPTAKIIDGTPVSETALPFVARLSVDGQLLCTGTLIGNHYVLTAAHCFFGDNNRREVGDSDVTVRMNGAEYRSTKVTIHPTYVSRSQACTEGETDAAVVELESNVPDITPVELLDAPLPLGSSLILAGYGALGNGSTGQNNQEPPVGTMYIGSTILEGYGTNPPNQNGESNYIYWTFDQGESNTASGDSGGPALYDFAGRYYLAAFTCGGDGNAEIGTLSFDTRADVVKSWVSSIIGDGSGGGTSPTPTPTPSPNHSLTLKKALLQLDYTRGSEDFLDITGSISVGSKFKPAGKKIKVQVGSYSKTFKLTSNGESSGSSKTYLDFIGSISGGAFKKSTVKFNLTFEKGPLFAELINLGFSPSDEAVDGQEASLPVSITVNGSESTQTVTLVFRERDERWAIKR